MKKSRLYIFLSIILITITLLPLFILCQYNHPQHFDNYRTYEYYQENGFTHDMHTFFSPGTRFVSVIYNQLLRLPISLDVNDINLLLTVFRLSSMFIILFFSISLFFLCFVLNKFLVRAAYSKLFILYSVLLFVIINSLPRIDFFFYEMVMVCYTLGINLFFIYLGLIIIYYHKKDILSLFFSCIVLFFLCGTIEYFTVLAGYSAFIYLCVYFLKKRSLDVFVLFHLIYCLVVFYLFATAHGTYDKISIYSGGAQNIYTFQRFFVWFINVTRELYNAGSFVLQRKILPFIILIFILLKNNINNYGKKIVFFLILNYLVSYVMAAFIFISGITSLDVLPNTMQIPYILMVINTILLILYFLSHLYRYSKIVFEYKNIDILSIFNSFNRVSVSLLLFLILFASIFNRGLPIRQAWKDVLRGTAKKYNQEVLLIYEKIKNTHTDTVIVNETVNLPLTLTKNSYMSNLWSTHGAYPYQKEFFENEGAVARFFGKKNIIIKGTENE